MNAECDFINAAVGGGGLEGFCVRCYQCCCGNGEERIERRAMTSTTELSNRSLLGGDDDGEAGSNDGVDEREAESKTPTVYAGAAGSTLETPLHMDEV